MQLGPTAALSDPSRSQTFFSLRRASARRTLPARTLPACIPFHGNLSGLPTHHHPVNGFLDDGQNCDCTKKHHEGVGIGHQFHVVAFPIFRSKTVIVAFSMSLLIDINNCNNLLTVFTEPLQEMRKLQH